jgi:hypothetical protein
MSHDQRMAQLEIGQRLRQLREAQGLTQAQWRDLIAQKCGVSVDQSSLSRMENGVQAVPLGWMPCLARLGGRDPAWLAWGLDPLPQGAAVARRVAGTAGESRRVRRRS